MLRINIRFNRIIIKDCGRIERVKEILESYSIDYDIADNDVIVYDDRAFTAMYVLAYHYDMEVV